MNKLKVLSIIISLLLTTQISFAGDFTQNDVSVSEFANPEAESMIGPGNTTGMPIFDKNSKKIIHVKPKNKLFKGFSLGKKNKKNNEKVIIPQVIDYDYDTETEEIIPVVNEVQQEEPKVEEITVKEDKGKNKKQKDKVEENPKMSAPDVNIYCDNMDYNDEKKEITGTGNAKVVFTENGSVMTAKKIIYNHDLNYIEGIDDVKIVRNDQTMYGDYTKVDLNFGNAMVDKPIIENVLVKVSAKTGSVTTDSLEAYDGIAESKENLERRLYSGPYATYFQMDVNEGMYRKFYPKDYRNKNTKYHIKTKELYVDSTDGHDKLTFKNADIYCGKVLMMKGSDLSLSTDKNQSFIETTLPEVGSIRHVGAYIGPGFVFNTPMSSTLKIAPLLSKGDKRFGIGILARFRHEKNITEAIYTTAENELVLSGYQKLGDTDFRLEYAHLAYVNEWFLGSNISKYFAQLAYNKQYLIPELGLSYMHRATAGYLTDEKGKSGTLRFRYQAMASKNLLEYRNFDRKFYAALDLNVQGAMALYGTGDSAGIFRIGPSIRTQYRGWGQQISYYQTAIGGCSPLKYTDDYRYGHSTVHLIESLRLNKYVSLAYSAALNLENNDITTSNMFSESRIMVSFGPEDARLSIGYDMIRQGTMLYYTALIGTKNQDISFKKLFMKNPDKLGKSNKKEKKVRKPFTVYEDPNKDLPWNYSKNNGKTEKNDTEENDEDFSDIMQSQAKFSF